MRSVIAALGVLLWLLPQVSAMTYGQLCSRTHTMANGNSYCAEVTKIVYQNVSQPGSYNHTVNMDPNTGLCSHGNTTYSGTGSLTPLFGEVSMHLRGPMNLTQLAVYTIATVRGSRRSHLDSHVHAKKHAHGNHERHVKDAREFRTDVPEQQRTLASYFDMRPSGYSSGQYHPARSSPAVPSSSTGISSMIAPTTNEQLSTITGVTLTSMSSSNSDITRSEGTPKVIGSSDSTTMSFLGTEDAIATTEVTIDVTVTVWATDCKVSPAADMSSTSNIALNSPVATASSDPVAMSTAGTVVLTTSTYGQSSIVSAAASTISSEPTSLSSPSSAVSVAAAGWSRIAYYNSEAAAQATGFAFLNNRGDPGVSGTFDFAFGNSLSYASSDGSTCASQNTPFSGNLSTSEIELAVFTDTSCDGDCGYYRPNSTAHHGWTGESKAFFIEFQMDHHNNTSNDQGLISDAPAFWFLNANIPRTLQYGSDRNGIPCSCWSTGCGEFDAFEILAWGEERAKSTLHRQGNLEGGDSNWFPRPVGKTIKFAVVFYDYNITATVLDDSFDFSDGLSASQIADIISYNSNSYSESLFAIGA